MPVDGGRRRSNATPCRLMPEFYDPVIRLEPGGGASETDNLLTVSFLRCDDPRMPDIATPCSDPSLPT